MNRMPSVSQRSRCFVWVKSVSPRIVTRRKPPRGLALVMAQLGKDEGCPALALPALGSFLWSREALTDLAGCDLANADLLEAIRGDSDTINSTAGAMEQRIRSRRLVAVWDRASQHNRRVCVIT